MTRTISRGTIEYALNNADIQHGEITATYTGRNMYGDQCLSITFVGKRIQRQLCRFFAELAFAVDTNDVDVDDVTELADAVATDDLGLDMIVYFPGWTLA